MHTYLRAIGFSNINNREELEELLGNAMTDTAYKESYEISKTEKFVEISKEYCTQMGLTIRGTYDQKGFFHLEHYFPYFKSDYVSIKDEISINKKVDNTAYSCMCDDIRFGVSLIFYLQNAVDYMKVFERFKESDFAYNVTLSGLSTEGKILLPVDKSNKSAESKTNENNNHNKLIAEAKKGNQEAIDSLTMEDIDKYSMIMRRAKYEDIYSIVDTTFFPFGAESDNYAIIGTILENNLVTNIYSGELVYDLLIECNELIFRICIHKDDLYGIPAPGSRFKGTIWLQGSVDFNRANY